MNKLPFGDSQVLYYIVLYTQARGFVQKVPFLLGLHSDSPRQWTSRVPLTFI